MSRYKKILGGMFLAILAMGVFTQTPLFDRLVLKIQGKHTVEERIAQYGSQARLRLLPYFKRAGVDYPPQEIVLLGLKEERELQVFASGADGTLRHIHAYPVLAASGKPGPKLARGDLQVPEGVYRIVFLNANSLYHLSLRLNYPNDFDLAMAKQDGRQDSDLGGDIMIHGNNVSVGCLAVGDQAIEEIFTLAYDCGIQNIRVILAPRDLRNRTFPESPGLPDWSTSLYRDLKEEMEKLPQNAGD